MVNVTAILITRIAFAVLFVYKLKADDKNQFEKETDNFLLSKSIRKCCCSIPSFIWRKGLGGEMDPVNYIRTI